MPVAAVLVFLFSLTASAYAFDFSGWDAILKKNTRPANYGGIEYTGFDYAALRGSREFDALFAGLDSFPPSELHGRDETLAFWINVYNIFAVKLVRDHYPVAGIKDVGSLFSPVWKKPAGKVGGKSYSLDDIEQGILRPMKEPGIHFAIVCASVSCPDLRPEAYTASALKDQLKSQAVLFLANGGKGLRIDRDKMTAHLSKIFGWYEKDFDASGGVIGFINSRGGSIPPGYAAEYLPYNWDLNTVR